MNEMEASTDNPEAEFEFRRATVRMPAQRPGRSKQDYGTPLDFMRACEARFKVNHFAVDLAAREDNKLAPICITEEQNSLTVDWHKLQGLLWLNPPFSNLELWAAKCKLEASCGAQIVMLTPASVGSNWYAKHVFGHAHSLFLSPRLTFQGCKDPYPKDCMLTLWNVESWHDEACSLWNWKK